MLPLLKGLNHEYLYALTFHRIQLLQSVQETCRESGSKQRRKNNLLSSMRFIPFPRRILQTENHFKQSFSPTSWHQMHRGVKHLSIFKCLMTLMVLRMRTAERVLTFRQKDFIYGDCQIGKKEKLRIRSKQRKIIVSI